MFIVEMRSTRLSRKFFIWSFILCGLILFGFTMLTMHVRLRSEGSPPQTGRKGPHA